MLQKPSHQCALVVTTMTHKPGKKQVLGWFPFLSPSFRLVCRPAAGHSPSASCYPLHLSSRSDWSPQVMSPISGQVYHRCAEWILRKTILFSDVECTHLKKKNLIKSIKESLIFTCQNYQQKITILHWLSFWIPQEFFTQHDIINLNIQAGPQ